MKRVLTFTLAAIMAFSTLAGCGKGATGSTDSPSSSSAATSVSASQAASSKPQETVKLKAFARTSGSNADWPNVNKKINEYLKDKINVEVDYQLIDFGSLSQQMSLIASSGERADLITPHTTQLIPFSSQGALVPMNDLLDQYGQGIRKLYDESILQSCAYEGQVYAIPTNREQAKGFGYYYRKDLNEKYKLGLDKADSYEKLEAAFQSAKAQNPALLGVLASTSISPMNATCDWDRIGNDNFGVLMNMGKELKIENLYTTDRYKEWITRMRKWNQAGYISPEAVTISLNERDGMGTGNVLGYFNNYKPGMENELSRNCGQEVARAPIAEGLSGLMTSQSINNVSWAISRNTASKEHAMQLLNLMYTDATLVNMLCYGLENEHYVFTDDTKKVIDYPAGVTAAAKKVDNGTGWQWGNQLLAYIWKGDSPTLWDDVSKYNAAAPRSAALGFVFDNAKVQNEITACTNVLAKYGPGLERGAVNPDEVLPEFQAALKSAGIETIMAEKQAQLDKWAKTKK